MAMLFSFYMEVDFGNYILEIWQSLDVLHILTDRYVVDSYVISMSTSSHIMQ